MLNSKVMKPTCIKHFKNKNKDINPLKKISEHKACRFTSGLCLGMWERVTNKAYIKER